MEPKIRFSNSNILYEEKTLSEISTINPKTNVPLEFEYVDLESVSGTEMTNHRTEHKATAPSRAQRLAKKGDIFYQTVRPYQKNNYYFDMDDDNYVFSTGYAQIRPSIYGKYLFTLLQNDSFLKQVLDNCAGTSFPAINPSVLSRLSVRICTDKQEQQAIASYFTSIDSQISASTSRLASLKQMKAASLQAMFPQEGETVPKVRFKGFEGEWNISRLGDFSTSFSGGTPTAGVTEFYGGEIPFIRSGEIHENRTELFLTEAGINNSSAKVVEKGTLLYALYGATSGEVGISKIKGAINQAILAIYPNKSVNKIFLSNYLQLKKQRIVGEFLQGGQGNLSGALVKSILVTYPSLEEQQAIASYFTSLDHQISLQTQRLEKLKQIKSACLDKMFV